MGELLTVHTHNRLEVLLDALAARIAAAPLPPLCAETIVVPGQGMARWVTLGLAQRHGVAATLELPFPGSFLQGLTRGDALAAAAEPLFERGALALRLFRLLGDPRLVKDLGAAAVYCQGDPEQHKRLQLATRLAQCFDDYQLYRDDLLLAFERGEAGQGTPGHGTPGQAAPGLGPHAKWQLRLWQELLREVATPAVDERTRGEAVAGGGQGLLFAAAPAAPSGPAAAHRLEHLRHLLADPERARAVLPPRLSVFGLTTLPPAFLDLLSRIAAHVEVVIYAPKATPHYYGDVRRDRTGRPRPRGSGHPLLAAWGAQSREFFDLLLDHDAGGAELPLEFEDPGTGTLLRALQSDLMHLHARHRSGDVPPLPLAADDESISVHSAHGPLREMEVLRDQLLHALQQDPTLRPSDVLVLLPNVQDHAPYVQAVFGPVQRLLPFHIADRSPAADLPVPALLLRVCALARGRFTAPELLLLLEEPALARRFGIARPDLLALRTWVHRTRIRWGLDGEQRKQDLGLPADDANTWRQGLERLLLGVATGPQDEPMLGVLPAADGSAGRALLLGRFLAFVDAIGATCRALGRPHTLQAWADLVDAFAADLFDPQDDDERHGVLHLQAVARRLRDLHATTALREELQPAAFQAWLQDELQARGDSRGFLSGSITFAALRPMRAVPMRVLAICGLGDGAFPRRGQRPVFDLMQHERRPGDRSVRDDDRQLFLDAVLAARDRLVLTWVGRSSKDNSECAPSPLVSELLEHLDLAFTPPAGCARARDAVLVDHPLQAFSPRYGAQDRRLFTYADLSRARRVAAAPRPLAPAADDAGAGAGEHRERIERIDFADLLRFWNHPPRWYCRNVLDVRFPQEDDRDDDAEPFALHNLDRYVLVDGSVRARLLERGDPLQSGAVLQTGILPPGSLGRLTHAALALESTRFTARVAAERGTGRRPFVVRGDDYELHGELDGLRPDALVLWRSTRVKNKDRMRAWLHHVAMCAAREQLLAVGADAAALPETTRLLGTDGRIDAPPCSPALPRLDVLVRGYRQSRRGVLPFLPNASAAYAETLDKWQDEDRALTAARRTYEPARIERQSYHHDLPDPCLELCFRDRDPIAEPEFVHWALQVFGPARTFFGAVEPHA